MWSFTLIKSMDGWARGEYRAFPAKQLILSGYCRADLEQERSKAEYERGYKKVLSWFREYL
jgi:hypothetical protein